MAKGGSFPQKIVDYYANYLNEKNKFLERVNANYLFDHEIVNAIIEDSEEEA